MGRYLSVTYGKGIVLFGALVLMVLAPLRPSLPSRAAKAEARQDRTWTGKFASMGGGGTTAAVTPDVVGQWGSLIAWPVVAIHGVLLHTGEVAVWDAWEYGSTPSVRLWNARF